MPAVQASSVRKSSRQPPRGDASPKGGSRAESVSKAEKKKRSPAPRAVHSNEREQDEQRQKANAQAVAAPLLGPKLDVPYVAPVPPLDAQGAIGSFSSLFKPIADAAGGLFGGNGSPSQEQLPALRFQGASGGMTQDGTLGGGTDVSPGVANGTTETVPLNGGANATGKKKGFFFARKKLPDALVYENGNEETVSGFYNKWNLAKHYWLSTQLPGLFLRKSYPQEQVSKVVEGAKKFMERSVGAVRPRKDGVLGEPIHVPSFVQGLEDIASPKNKQDAEGFVASRGAAPSQGPTEKIRAIVGRDHRVVDMELFEPRVMNEALNSRSAYLGRAQLDVLRTMKEHLGLSDEGDEVVTLQTLGNKRTFPIHFSRLSEAISNNFDRPLRFNELPTSLLDEYESEAQSSGLSGPDAVRTEVLDAARLEKFIKDGHPLEIQYVDFLEPSEAMVQAWRRTTQERGPVAGSSPEDSFRGMSIDQVVEMFVGDFNWARNVHEVPAVILRSRKSAQEMMLGELGADPVAFSKQMGLPTVSNQTILREAVSQFVGRAKYVNLYDEHKNFVGRLRMEDWLRMFPLPLPGHLGDQIKEIQAAPSKILAIKSKGAHFKPDSTHWKELRDLLASKETAQEVTDHLLKWMGKKHRMDDPSIILALRTLKLKGAKDTFAIQMDGQDAPARRMSFGTLIEFLKSQPDLPNIDMKKLDELLGVT